MSIYLERARYPTIGRRPLRRLKAHKYFQYWVDEREVVQQLPTDSQPQLWDRTKVFDLSHPIPLSPEWSTVVDERGERTRGLRAGDFLTRVARSARSASEIPFKPIWDQGREVVGGYLLHVDKL